MIRELIQKNRSYRRFDEKVKITADQLAKWVELARFSASGRNMQPLKYVLCTKDETTDKVFPLIGWAGYLTHWKGPVKGERPTAYIAVLHDKSLSDGYFCDDGIAMQSILLGAVEDGFGGCIIGSFNKRKVKKLLELPDYVETLWLIALGKPAELSVIDDVANGDIKYWRGDDEVHHVPKRSLDELIFKTT